MADELVIPKRPASNARKTALLGGMPFGTAAARLRKAIMFRLVVQCGENVCFRCKLLIESVDELSIEHKESWQRAADPVAAFFDQGNISFSHLSCNVAEKVSPFQIYATSKIA